MPDPGGATPPGGPALFVLPIAVEEGSVGLNTDKLEDVGVDALAAFGTCASAVSGSSDMGEDVSLPGEPERERVVWVRAWD